MAKINLLPWREELKEKRKNEFITMLVVALLVGGGIAFGVNMAIGQMIDNQKSRNDRLQAEIKILDKKIKTIKDLERQKAQLEQRMKVITDLQKQRPEAVHLFDEVVQTLPSGVFLKSVKQTGNKLTLEGTAQSNARVSTYMENIDASAWLTKPVLKGIKTEAKGDAGRASEFTLFASQTQPKADDSKQ